MSDFRGHMTDPEDRLWQQLFRRLDTIELKLDDRVSRTEFMEFKKEMTSRAERTQEDIEKLEHAAIRPDQVTNMIGDKLKESQARGVTQHERSVRYLVAAASLGTFGFLVYDNIFR